jgi:gas vesicle protein
MTNMSKTAIKLVAAAAVGFVAGVLLAPKRGEETIEDIKRKALDAKDYADAKAERLQRVAQRGYATLRSGAEDIGEEVGEFVTHAKTSGAKLSREAKTRGKRVATKAETTGRRVRRQAEEDLD